MARILVAVTHLLGSGHLVRARHLARAFALAGHEVTLASGGMPPAASTDEPFAVVQLLPVKVEGVAFRHLLDEAGRPIDESRRAARIVQLRDLATEWRPDVVIVEHFPFGRRQLADEFLASIEAARAVRPDALVLSSIRDVLVTPRADRIAQAHERIAALFDGVLVHGDEGFLPLGMSWPASADLAGTLHYTGYVVPPSWHAQRTDPATDEPGRPRATPADGGILVSGGGSGAALPLFRLCIEAASLLGASRPWRILVGRAVPRNAFDALLASAPAHVAVEWARPDFPALLSRAALSISQAGYNTVLDLVVANRPALVVPFDDGGETEQAVRAAAMERAGLARCLTMDGLTGARLAAAIGDALAAPPPRRLALACDGASRSVAIVESLLATR